MADAFDFRLTAEEQWDGYALYVIEATPRPGYLPRSRTAKVLVHLQGKLWVDKQDYHLVKAEVEVVDTISVGLFLVRLAKGSRATFEQARVNEEVWLPRHVWAFVSARVGLLKVLRIEQESSYTRGWSSGPLSQSSMSTRGVLLGVSGRCSARAADRDRITPIVVGPPSFRSK